MFVLDQEVITKECVIAVYPEVECPVCRTKIPLDKVRKARVLLRNSEYAIAPTIL